MHLLTPGLVSHLSAKHHSTANYVSSRMAWKPFSVQIANNSFVCASAQQLNVAQTDSSRAQVEQKVKFAKYEERDLIVGYTLTASCPLCGEYTEQIDTTAPRVRTPTVPVPAQSTSVSDDRELTWKSDLDEFAKSGASITSTEWNERFSHIPSDFVDQYMLTSSSPGIVVVADSPVPYYASKASKFPRCHEGMITIPNSINGATPLQYGKLIPAVTVGHEARCRYVDLRFPAKKRLLLHVYDEVEDVEEEEDDDDEIQQSSPDHAEPQHPTVTPQRSASSPPAPSAFHAPSSPIPQRVASTSSFSLMEEGSPVAPVSMFDHRRAASPLSRPDTPRYATRTRSDRLCDPDISSAMKAIAQLTACGVLTTSEAREMLVDLGVI
ncbi:P9 [Mycoreovirus 3]|uniref:P9 n=1 Tax=Rosellinia necatrix mycoreovirus 3 (isolate W370) TaxID=311229 RepID=Q8JXF1_MYRVW|nr:P9 [Mycoreovirus 3]BAC07522.1 P9 [Mycoreovirus 3]